MTPGLVLGVALPEFVYEALRVVAAVLGFLGGWFIGGPLARGLVKLAFQKSLREGGQFAARFLVAAAAGLLIYFYLPLGPGLGGGGSGTGGGTGEGIGSGTASSGLGDPRKPGDSKGAGTQPKAGKGDIPPDALPIEVLGGTRKERRFYRVLGKEMNLEEVDAFLDEKRAKWKEVYIVLTREDAPIELPGAPKPITNLKDLVVDKHRMLWKVVHR